MHDSIDYLAQNNFAGIGSELVPTDIYKYSINVGDYDINIGNYIAPSFNTYIKYKSIETFNSKPYNKSKMILSKTKSNVISYFNTKYAPIYESYDLSSKL